MSVCICIFLFLANICPAVCLSSQRERANNNNTKKREEREEREEGGRRREGREGKTLPDCVHMCNRSSSRSGHLFLVMATPREGTHAEQLDQQHTHQAGRKPANSPQTTRETGTRKRNYLHPAQDNHHHGTIAAATASFCWVCLVFLEDSSGSAHGKTSCLLLLDGSIVLDT